MTTATATASRVRRFDDDPTWTSRAVQAWMILVGAAHNRQTVTYGMIADLLRYEGAGTLGHVLAPILYFCQQHNLPALTALVVNQQRGHPGPGFFVSGTSTDAAREKVYGFPWYEIVPPTADEFAAASEAAR